MTYNRSIAKAICTFVLCPATGKTADGVAGDDKVYCHCGKTHLVSLCQPSSVERFMEERGLEPMA